MALCIICKLSPAFLLTAEVHTFSRGRRRQNLKLKHFCYYRTDGWQYVNVEFKSSQCRRGEKSQGQQTSTAEKNLKMIPFVPKHDSDDYQRTTVNIYMYMHIKNNSDYWYSCFIIIYVTWIPLANDSGSDLFGAALQFQHHWRILQILSWF